MHVEELCICIRMIQTKIPPPPKKLRALCMLSVHYQRATPPAPEDFSFPGTKQPDSQDYVEK